MKTSEIKEMTTKELLEILDNEQSDLSKLRLNHSISPLDNPMKIREARKRIAKLNTELKMRSKNENQ